MIEQQEVPSELYNQCIAAMPRSCADTVIMTLSGKVLILRRAIEPDKGNWALAGGAIRKSETVPEACGRKVLQETGLHIEISRLLLVGVFEYFHTERHDICLTYLYRIDKEQSVLLDYQHDKAEWVFEDKMPVAMNPVTREQYEAAFRRF